MEPVIELERKGAIALVRLNRPHKKNAFDEDMWRRLEEINAALQGTAGLRAVVVCGAGAAFSAGFDVSPENPQVLRLYEALQNHDSRAAVDLIATIRRAVDGFVSLPVPLIAAVNGVAYGGGAELAVRCDLRVADPAAVFCFSEVRLGLMPDWGGTPALTRLVGPAVAAELILTARAVAAAEARALGLVNRISARGAVLEEALALAGSIAANGPLAVRAALGTIRGTYEPTCRQALALEQRQAVDLIAAGECLHGITAFLEKREPEFPDPA